MIQQMDLSILLWIQENLREEFMNEFWKAVTFLGNAGWFWIALGIGLLLCKRSRPAGAAVLIALALGALVTNVCLKNLVARIRPYEISQQIILLVAPARDFSFPSGHTCASFAAAAACMGMLPRKYGIAALLLAGMIAFSRLYVGIHFPTDVLGGVLVGCLSGMAAVRLVRSGFMQNRKGDRDGHIG